MADVKTCAQATKRIRHNKELNADAMIVFKEETTAKLEEAHARTYAELAEAKNQAESESSACKEEIEKLKGALAHEKKLAADTKTRLEEAHGQIRAEAEERAKSKTLGQSLANENKKLKGALADEKRLAADQKTQLEQALDQARVELAKTKSEASVQDIETLKETKTRLEGLHDQARAELAEAKKQAESELSACKEELEKSKEALAFEETYEKLKWEETVRELETCLNGVGGFASTHARTHAHPPAHPPAHPQRNATQHNTTQRNVHTQVGHFAAGTAGKDAQSHPEVEADMPVRVHGRVRARSLKPRTHLYKVLGICTRPRCRLSAHLPCATSAQTQRTSAVHMWV